MNWQLTHYAAALVLAVVISIALAVYVARRSRSPSTPFFTLLLFSVAVWSLGYALELISTSLAAKILWAKVQYPGIAVAPVAWFTFVMHYSGYVTLITRRRLLLLGIVPWLTVALVLTNEAHGLIWQQIQLDRSGPFVALSVRYGPWFWVHTLYSYLLMSVGSISMCARLVRTPHLYRRQIGALLVAVIAPWLGNTLYLTQYGPVHGLDLTPFGFWLSGITVAWALFRYRLLEIVPVARNAIIEGMRDAVIVLDVQSRIVDCNPAAQRVLGRPSDQLIGTPAAQSLPPAVARLVDGGSADVQTNIMLELDNERHDYDVTSSCLVRRHRPAGQIIVMRDTTKRVRAETALRDNEARYRVVSELTSDYTYAMRVNVDQSTDLEWVTDAFERISGYTGAEVTARGGWRTIVYPDDLPTLLCYARTLLEEQSGVTEFRIVTKDGSLRWIRHYGRTVFDTEQQRVVRVLGAGKDITVRKLTEAALRESEQHYRLLFGSTPVPMWLFDVETLAFLAVNTAAVEHYGYSEAEFLAMTIKDIRPPDDVPQLLDRITNSGGCSNVADRWRHRKKDGTLIDVEITSHPINVAGRAAKICLANDITERARTEAALRQQNEYFAALHDTTLAIMRRLDVADVLEAIVIRAGGLVGTTHGYIYLTADDGTVDDLVVQVGVGMFRPYIGYRLKRGIGVAGVVWETAQPVVVNHYDAWEDRSPDSMWNALRAIAGVPLTSGTQVVGVLGLAYLEPNRTFGKDEIDILRRFGQLASLALDNARLYTTAQQEITERKRAESALAEARDQALEAARLKSAFLATMSHELRTPLNAIIGFTDLTLEQEVGPLNEQQQQMLNRVSRNARKLLALINEILDMSKVDAGQMQLADELVIIDNVIHSATASVETLVGRKQLRLTVQPSHTPLPPVRADCGRLEQVILNLLGNAVKFTPAHGVIRVVLEHGRADTLAVAARPSENMGDRHWVAVSVQDTGIGIPLEEQERIWSEFYQIDGSTTRQYGGTGLGLAITRRLTLLMNGHVALRSTPDRGSTFTIWLPTADVAIAANTSPRQIEPATTILGAEACPVQPRALVHNE